jgi:hypothetical protein
MILMHARASEFTSRKAAAVACRVSVCAVCLLIASLCTHAQLDLNNFEGPNLPEVLLSAPFDVESQGEKLAQGSQEQLTIVAIDEVPVASISDRQSLWQQEATYASVADHFNLTAPQSTAAGAAATDVEAVEVAAHSALSAAAAAAPVAVNGPAIGLPVLGSVIPGRYVVFFDSNVSDVNSGIQR